MKATKILFRNEAPQVVLWGLHKASSGPFMIGITLTGAVCCTAFASNKKPEDILSAWRKEWPRTEFIKDEKKTAPVAKKIATAKTLPTLQMTGTKFQHSVWKGMLGIPSGKTVSYSRLAKRIKNPGAARAVGSACGANPIPLLVPCHRVIAKDGSIGGFSSGLEVKKALLKMEAKHARNFGAYCTKNSALQKRKSLGLINS